MIFPSKYLKFLIVGSFLGICSIFLQRLFFILLGGNTSFEYMSATALTYLPLLFINFFLQKKWVFRSSGMILKFFVANLSVMLMVSSCSPLVRLFISSFFSQSTADKYAFGLAAIFMSIPSYLIKKNFVFNE